MTRRPAEATARRRAGARRRRPSGSRSRAARSSSSRRPGRRSAPASGCSRPRRRRRARPPRPRGARARRGRAAPRSSAASRGGSTRSSATSGDRRHRPRVGERDPPHGEALAVRALDRPRRRGGRAARGCDARRARPRARAARARARRTSATYRVHNRLGQPCHVCGTPLAQIDFEEHTIYYCPRVPDRRPRAQGPAALPAAALRYRSQAHGHRRGARW